jgi:SAM-dependent methyltransferase
MLRTVALLLRRVKGQFLKKKINVMQFGEPIYRRYLSNRLGRFDDYLSAARSYVSKKSEQEYLWLYCKPYEMSPGNKAFFTEMYQVMNLLEAMNVPYGGKLLEVGSGPGWVSEILVALGFELHGLEPSKDMIEIAKERVAGAITHWKIKNPPRYHFFCQTLEECTLPSDEYDGILFHAALHHVIDEKAGLTQCYRMLRPGGVLGISEAAWQPDNKALEAALDEEMDRFGTLENPFTREYLDHLLSVTGFVDIQRYHAINGFIPENMGGRSIESLAQAPASTSNNLTAIKEGETPLTTRNHPSDTTAEIRILSVILYAEQQYFDLEIELTNTGKTVWLDRSKERGWVTIAVRSEKLGDQNFTELPRNNLPKSVYPGERLRLKFRYALPKDYTEVNWYIDLVNEGIFWFSTCGTLHAALKIS